MKKSIYIIALLISLLLSCAAISAETKYNTALEAALNQKGIMVGYDFEQMCVFVSGPYNMLQMDAMIVYLPGEKPLKGIRIDILHASKSDVAYIDYDEIPAWISGISLLLIYGKAPDTNGIRSYTTKDTLRIAIVPDIYNPAVMVSMRKTPENEVGYILDGIGLERFRDYANEAFEYLKTH